MVKSFIAAATSLRFVTVRLISIPFIFISRLPFGTGGCPAVGIVIPAPAFPENKALASA